MIHDGEIVSADINDEIELHFPVPQKMTNTHLSSFIPWSPTVVNGQRNMETVVSWPFSTTVSKYMSVQGLVGPMLCVSPLNETGRSEVSVQSKLLSIKLLFYESFCHATLSLSALGFSKNPACSTGARHHPYFDLFAADIFTIICHRVHWKRIFYVSWYPDLSGR